jgi:hypothetical protein
MSHDCKAKCVAGWPSTARSHCTVCSRNFSCPKNFDKHRDNDKCLDPRTVGLMLNKLNTWVRKGEVDEEESSTP